MIYFLVISNLILALLSFIALLRAIKNKNTKYKAKLRLMPGFITVILLSNTYIIIKYLSKII